jgi:predicted Kef-type K+ transport protein
LLAGHPKAVELKHHLVEFQDLFLVGFFLQVGSQGLTLTSVGIGLLISLLLPLKGVLWQLLFMGSRMKPRVAFTTTTSLFSYSEFALIVMTYSVKLKYAFSSSHLIFLCQPTRFSPPA